MTAEQAGWCSLEEYRLRVEGKQEEERLSWEKARWQCFLLMRMHPYIKQKPNTPQEWIRFPWEQEHPDLGQVDCRVSEDEQDRLKDIFSRIGDGQDR